MSDSVKEYVRVEDTKADVVNVVDSVKDDNEEKQSVTSEVTGGTKDWLQYDEIPDEGWRGTLKSINEAIDMIVGPRSRVIKMVKACICGLVGVTFAMIRVEMTRLQEDKEFMIEYYNEIVNNPSIEVPEWYVNPSDMVWYKELRVLMWIGLGLLTLGFTFAFSFFVSQIEEEDVTNSPKKVEESKEEVIESIVTKLKGKDDKILISRDMKPESTTTKGSSNRKDKTSTTSTTRQRNPKYT